MVGNGVIDLQLRLFAVFNFLFIAGGVINQLQPLFMGCRDIFEAREKKVCEYTCNLIHHADTLATPVQNLRLVSVCCCSINR